ncbi:nitroreductase [Amphritea pacifica]|uniref:Putative NAD(P)H nitroreductase n=1 Tax=Amphritea pacifica TaxID=2811233 RepID=A0ABS2WE69_9GAMM|nr:nitroreductase [Amphritea pacifica]MBN0989647.1 nitroreductase [Amphritea pacifica]MBN1006588.1 nitroreductase [Amphritea pacifica]
MDAIDNLLNRVSIPRLEGPAPSADQLDILFRAALRAPDHGALRPWRFLTIQGDALYKLGQLYVQAALQDEPGLAAEKRTKLENMPLRAPLLIVAIAALQEHFKVPGSEQLIAAGCAVQNMLLAAHAQGLGAMWRTGDMAYNATVKKGLGLSEHEQIIGFIYLGAPAKGKPVPQLEVNDFVTEWN